jgi:hypothetical protein
MGAIGLLGLLYGAESVYIFVAIVVLGVGLD